MDKKKTKASTEVAEADVEFATAVDELTDAIVEDLEESYDSELEPFEAYAQRVRAQIHSNMDEFRKRFLQGYEVLLKELSERYTKMDEEPEEEPPPGAMKL
ncbi:MAG: hypothetical protein ACE5GN_07110 [Waddliaceae bacterium]